jgi:hypothetical protein
VARRGSSVGHAGRKSSGVGEPHNSRKLPNVSFGEKENKRNECVGEIDESIFLAARRQKRKQVRQQKWDSDSDFTYILHIAGKAVTHPAPDPGPLGNKMPNQWNSTLFRPQNC